MISTLALAKQGAALRLHGDTSSLALLDEHEAARHMTVTHRTTAHDLLDNVRHQYTSHVRDIGTYALGQVFGNVRRQRSLRNGLIGTVTRHLEMGVEQEWRP